MTSADDSRESVVYGCIKDVAYKDAAERSLANRNAILALPDQQGWPLISRDMFSLPGLEPVAALENSTALGSTVNHHSQVIHFGASYRGVEYEWTQWLEQFESLLKQMYWVSATVHLETELFGIHTFNWETSGSYHAPGSDDIRACCEWTREGWLSGG